MEIKLYSQYICLYDKEVGKEDLQKKLKGLVPPECISAQNLSGMTMDKKLTVLNNAFAAERVRIYDPELVNPMYVRLFYMGDRYLMIFSVCESGVSSMPSIYRRLFGYNQEVPFDMYGNEKSTFKTCEAYWKSRFASTRLKLPVQKQVENFDLSLEKFSASEELQSLIAKFLEEENRSIKSACYAVLGHLACKANEGSKILVMDMHEGGMLTYAPIIYDNSADNNDQYESIKDQLIKIEKYDNCSNLQLKHAIGIDFVHTPMVSAYLLYEKKYNSFFERIKENTVYSLMAPNMEMCPFSMIFDISKEQTTFSYVYDERVFEGFDINKLHELYCRMLLDFLKGKTNLSDSEYEVEKSTEDSDANMSRVQQAKIACLKRMELFRECSNREIAEISEKVAILPLRKEQDIIQVGGMGKGLLVPIRGNILVMGCDHDGFLNPLYKAHNGDIMGIESLIEDCKSEVCIRASSPDTILMYISKSAFLKVAAEHPNMWIYLLSMQQMTINKMEKLWLMS